MCRIMREYKKEQVAYLLADLILTGASDGNKP